MSISTVRAEMWPSPLVTLLASALKCAFLCCRLGPYSAISLELCKLEAGEEGRVWGKGPRAVLWRRRASAPNVLAPPQVPPANSFSQVLCSAYGAGVWCCVAPREVSCSFARA